VSLATAPRPGKARETAVEAESPQPPRTNYRPDIDGIRGTAAIMVMGYHAHVPGFEGTFIGLDLFFVVSGFVITGLLLGEFERTGRIRWSAFYARRARRLIPAKATMLFGILVISYFVMAPTGAQQDTARSAAAAAAFISNFFFWQIADVSYFANEPGTGVLLHTWSLSVEEQFYLALPLGVLLAYGLARVLKVHIGRTLLFTTLVLGIASLWAALTIVESDADAAYYLPITRAFEFLLGVLLALVVARVKAPVWLRQVMGLVGAGLCIYVFIDPMPTDKYPYTWALVPCAAAFLLIWAGTGSKTAVTHFLSFPPFVWLGLVSYGWYLWHWPLLVMGEAVNLGQPPLWVRIALVLAALGIAILSYHFIEGIFYKRSGHRNARKLYGGPRVVLTGVTTMLIVVTLAGGAFLVAKERATSPKWEAVLNQLADAPEMPDECLVGDELIPSKPVACQMVPYEEDRPTVVLWGDSHAWMYIPALEAAIKNKDVNFVTFVMGGCPPFLAHGHPSAGCAGSNRLAMDFVNYLRRGDQPYRVILSASWELYLEGEKALLNSKEVAARANPQYIAKMASVFDDSGPELFERLRELEIPTDVVAPTPSVARNAPLCEALTRPFSCDRDRREAIQNEDATRQWLREQMDGMAGGGGYDARFIDPIPEMCSDNTCYAERNGTVYFFDTNHLSATLSRELRGYFVPSIKAILPVT
jgi:peptidoglycan/LPS O-acetylase OafA/YrhL